MMSVACNLELTCLLTEILHLHNHMLLFEFCKENPWMVKIDERTCVTWISFKPY